MAAVLATIDEGLSLAIALMQASQQISSVVTGAAQAGRTVLTPEEWATIKGADDAARARLAADVT